MTEMELTMSLLTGLVSRVGSIMPLFAQPMTPSDASGLIDFMAVPMAVNEG